MTMAWLDRLKNQESPGTDATKATKGGSVAFVASIPACGAKNQTLKGGFVAFVASIPGDSQKINIAPIAAPAPEPDRWPHRAAMTEREMDTFTARLVRFADKGIPLPEAQALADKLTRRDRETDDRRLCTECAHLSGAGPWRCGNWRRADMPAALPPDWVRLLQRCPGHANLAALQAPQNERAHQHHHDKDS